MSSLDRAYARFLVDSHISEDKPSYMSRFDPANYVAMMKKAGVDSATVYACCHNGNCHYPTRVGHMHRNLKGRDIFGETVYLLRQEGITPLGYYTVIYHRQSALSNPDWRLQFVDGEQNFFRSWGCCPNSEGYRTYAKAQVAEIAAYDIDGMFIDITLWPGVCLCHSCRTRYLRESGREIPLTIDWNQPEWVGFQRSRERWLGEFARELTQAAKSVNPKILVAHQFACVLLGWWHGQSHLIAQASDFASGDFYGGRHQQRLVTKVLASFSVRMPFEFMTSRCVTLRDHTSNKSEAELICSTGTTLANGGAYLLIDALNVDGTMEPSVYDRLSRVEAAVRPFRERLALLRPVVVADVGLYVSTASYVRRRSNGVNVCAVLESNDNMLPASDLRPVQELLGTAIVLNRCKVPYRVLNEKTTDFTGLQSIIVNDAAYLSIDEVDRLRRFVHDGGTLIATGLTSYYDLDGNSSGNFALSDVFGVKCSGGFTKLWSYLVPETGDLVSCNAAAPLVEVITATRLARVADAVSNPEDPDHYASYHSNPPGDASEHAAFTVNQFGRGSCVYLYSSLLAMQNDAQQTFGASIVRRYAPSSILRATNAPHSVEVTLLRATESSAYLLCLVNYQEELPNLHIDNVWVTLSLPCGRTPIACHSVGMNRAAQFVTDANGITFHIPRLETIEMIELRMPENERDGIPLRCE
jgi:hypothetical protein